MFSEVYDGVLRTLNPRYSEERWRRIFDWPWENPEDHVGYALLDEDRRVVGYAGLIYSRQAIGEEEAICCNISSWVVEPPYRSSALSLIMPVIRRRDLTVTNLTSTPVVHKIFTGLGFSALETHISVFFPLHAFRPSPYRVTMGFEAFKEKLPPRLRRIGHEHEPLGLHFWAEGGEAPVYFVAVRGRRRLVPTARVHFISDPAAFAEALPAIQRKLMKSGIFLVECDDRLMKDVSVPFSGRIRLPVTRLYKSNALRPEDISNLYSEMILLGL